MQMHATSEEHAKVRRGAGACSSDGSVCNQVTPPLLVELKGGLEPLHCFTNEREPGRPVLGPACADQPPAAGCFQLLCSIPHDPEAAVVLNVERLPRWIKHGLSVDFPAAGI